MAYFFDVLINVQSKLIPPIHDLGLVKMDVTFQFVGHHRNPFQEATILSKLTEWSGCYSVGH